MAIPGKNRLKTRKYGPLQSKKDWMSMVDKVNGRFQYQRMIRRRMQQLHTMDAELPFIQPDSDIDEFIKAANAGDKTMVIHCYQVLRIKWLKVRYGTNVKITRNLLESMDGEM